MKIINRLLISVSLGLIRIYQFVISPVLGANCRFYPSCSNYAYEVVRRFGVVRGSRLAIKRILKCHPFHPGGFDPPPAHGNDEFQPS